MKTDNIFDNIPAEIPEELFKVLARQHAVRIERIVSKGHCSAKAFWYDQSWDEWILLIQGAAGLEVMDRTEAIELNKGDYLLIPAGVKHRVAWTAENETTIWLAVHIGRPDSEGKV